jgi:prefoldin subunit 5
LIDHPDVLQRGVYQVQNAIPPSCVDAFLRSINDGSELAMTPDSVWGLLLLSEEPGAAGLREACEQFASRGVKPLMTTRFAECDSRLADLSRVSESFNSRVDSELSGMREVLADLVAVGSKCDAGVAAAQELDKALQAIRSRCGELVGQFEKLKADLTSSLNGLSSRLAGVETAVRGLKQSKSVQAAEDLSRDSARPTSCPNHPSVSFALGDKFGDVKCPHCDYWLCGSCRRWRVKTRGSYSLPDFPLKERGSMSGIVAFLPVTTRWKSAGTSVRCESH